MNIVTDYGVTDANDVKNIIFNKNSDFIGLSDEEWEKQYASAVEYFRGVHERLMAEMPDDANWKTDTFSAMTPEERVACMNFIYSLLDAPTGIAVNVMMEYEMSSLYAPLMFWAGRTQACRDAYTRLSESEEYKRGQ